MRAPATLVLFSLANLAVLRQRIRIEEEALRQDTDYADRFGST
jgi:isoprenylcysteine carboxyl methyltransferase (ICMT) family protein YpbQ